MSSQKGNMSRTRPQKHKNVTAFKNDLHHNSHVVKNMNSMEFVGVCTRCKGIIEWRIKYSKYKPLTIPKKCVKCESKTVCYAYHVMCLQCANCNGVCAKCGTSQKELIPCGMTPADIAKQKSDLESDVKTLPERKRRSLLRAMKKGISLEETKTKVDVLKKEQDDDYLDLDSDFDSSDNDD